MMSESQSNCPTMNGQTDCGYGEIMLFGVRVKVDPLRKSVSMNDLSQYVHVQPPTRDSSSNSNNLDDVCAVVTGKSGYASADDAARSNQSNRGRERKRGVPWTEDEHKLFLLGLQKVGKGDWRGISRNFVKTRTPTQVASHAQKYFLRRSNLNRRRRRSSLFDITTDSVADIPMEKPQEVHKDNNNQPAQPPMQSSHQIPPLSGFPRAAFPAAVGPVDQFNGVVRPLPFLPTPNLSTRADNYVNQKYKRDSLSLSLSLNLSLSCDRNNGTGSSALQVISGLNNGDGLISVG